MRGSSLHSPVSMSAMSSINYLRLEHEDPVLWDVQAQHIFTWNRNVHTTDFYFRLMCSKEESAN